MHNSLRITYLAADTAPAVLTQMLSTVNPDSKLVDVRACPLHDLLVDAGVSFYLGEVKTLDEAVAKTTVSPGSFVWIEADGGFRKLIRSPHTIATNWSYPYGNQPIPQKAKSTREFVSSREFVSTREYVG